ncbi:hypothetical protein HII36_13490 [Nonomuraea sp. NN258]|uniref:hypothetical protein n=1 Tax=Nonomuraea antri TaxID=2730852 RepID=UPI00156884E8|nr:hypothetical protein [Nonomuraea antri]NRQ32846.1 hypothetical protein [Nonomuraea antri]
MPSLTIALEEGFSGERVTILLDGEVVFDQDGVRTRTQIGMAHTFTVETSPGEHRIEVRTRTRTQVGEQPPVEAAARADTGTAPVVRVSRHPSGLRMSADATPLRYL